MQKIFHRLDALAGGQTVAKSGIFIGELINNGIVVIIRPDEDGNPCVSIESAVPVDVDGVEQSMS